MREWSEPAPPGENAGLEAVAGGSPLVAQALLHRGICTPDAARAFLDPRCYTPAPATALPGMDEAARRIGYAIRRREPICVWGDFDVDGQSATALLVATLRDLGATVAHHIPVRATESHGVSLPVLQRVMADGARLVVTGDTGVSAHEALDWAQAHGLDVIVTDHHALPPTLPPAYAVVNPQRLPPSHPLRALPGVAVAYKLAEELYARAGRPAAVEAHLDLVALGIVADVAALCGDTRYLLQRGLAALRTTARPGLRALFEINGLDPACLTEEHIAFILAPRLNALGRLDDANPIVDFLNGADLARARILAAQLETLNARRKMLCDQVYAAAEAQIERTPALLADPVLVLSGEGWPAGVVGIVAGRLVERYGRPAILIATEQGQVARGSARSTPGCDITAAIAAHAHLLAGYGGHPLAAGFAIEAAHIPEFRRDLCRTVSGMRGPEPARLPLSIDGYLPLAALTADLAADLERLAPFGAGNPPLTLVSPRMTVSGARAMGRGGEHLLLTVADDEGNEHRVVWWGGAGSPLPTGRFDLAYSARRGDYRGRPQVQIEWIDSRPSDAGGALEVAPAGPRYTVIDCRAEGDPRAALAALRRESELAVWCEGPERAALGGLSREALLPAPALVIWTAPPGRAELAAALARAAPATVYLFAQDPGWDDPGSFLERLAGLIRYALRTTAGQTSLSALAAATAQRPAAVRYGVEWLAARGDISVLEDAGDELRLAPAGRPEVAGNAANAAQAAARLAQIRELLAETAAYRAYFRSAPAGAVL